MKIIVMSQREAEETEKFPENSIMISIVDNNAPWAKIKLGSLISILRMSFDDVEWNETKYATPMSKRDAEQIVGFVIHDIPEKNANYLIIHCTAGISRSAGIAAAIGKIFQDEQDWKFLNPKKYFPNMTCYRLVMEAYINQIDSIVIQEKDK